MRQALIYLWTREDIAFESGTDKAGLAATGQIVEGLTRERMRPDAAGVRVGVGTGSRVQDDC